MSRPQAYVTNLELRESNPDGSEGSGLSHSAEGLFLLHVLELASYGEPRGCVTVLHDAGDHGARYEDLAHVLAADGWAVALPDLRGHGRSEGERGHSWGFQEVARDVDAVLDHLAYRLPDEPQVLVGQGLGALQALAYAIERPGRVAALVLLSPVLSPVFQLPEKKGGLMGMFKKVGPTSPGTIGWAPAMRTSDGAAQAAFAADDKVHDVITLRGGEMAQEAKSRVDAGLAGLSTPTLILHGAADPIAPAGASPALARDGIEVRVVDGAQHDLVHDAGAQETMESIRDWVGATVARS
ncbi:MAG: alpha/beta fold hydrolase [Planctomycetota bacterium]